MNQKIFSLGCAFSVAASIQIFLFLIFPVLEQHAVGLAVALGEYRMAFVLPPLLGFAVGFVLARTQLESQRRWSNLGVAIAAIVGAGAGIAIGLLATCGVVAICV